MREIIPGVNRINYIIQCRIHLFHNEKAPSSRLTEISIDALLIMSGIMTIVIIVLDDRA